MNKHIKKYHNYKEVVDKNGVSHIVLVYGEVTENEHLYGYAPVTFTRKGRAIKTVGEPVIIDTLNKFRSPLKQFNMGYAICNNTDKFNEEYGIKVAKRRFAKSPLSTQNGTFLNVDMIRSIVDNELDYICENIEHFMKKARF
jgi:hypothetical protein